MNPWQEYDLSVNGARFHYLRTGGDKPPVVLLHGFSDSAPDWRRIIRILEPDYDVIGVDARGHGQSDPAPADYSLVDQAADMVAVVRALGVKPPAVLGHSMGAATAMEMAALAPDALRCVLLEDPPLRDDHPQLDEDGFIPWEVSAKAFKKLSHDKQMAHARSQMPLLPDEELADWVHSQIAFDTNLFHTPLFLARPDWHIAARKITIPGLLITGDPMRGALVSAERAQEAAGLWSELRIAHIENAGHSIRRDQAERYIAVVRAYLKEKMR